MARHMIPAMLVCLICKFSFVGETAHGDQSEIQQLRFETTDGNSGIGIEDGLFGQSKRTIADGRKCGPDKRRACERPPMIGRVCYSFATLRSIFDDNLSSR